MTTEGQQDYRIEQLVQSLEKVASRLDRFMEHVDLRFVRVDIYERDRGTLTQALKELADDAAEDRRMYVTGQKNLLDEITADRKARAAQQEKADAAAREERRWRANLTVSVIALAVTLLLGLVSAVIGVVAL